MKVQEYLGGLVDDLGKLEDLRKIEQRIYCQCEYMYKCPDIKRREELKERGEVDKDLESQLTELCNVVIAIGGCSRRTKYIQEEQIRGAN